MLHEQHRQYEEYYVLRFTPGTTKDGIPGGPTNMDETVPVSSLRGAGRTAAEAEADLAQITEALGRGNFADEEDGEPEGLDGSPAGREPASGGAAEQVLDPTHHASLTPARRN